MKNITEEQVTEAMRQVIEEKGADYVYPEEEKLIHGGGQMCRYGTEKGEPLCLIGHVIVKLGTTLHRQMEGRPASGVLRSIGVTDERVLEAADRAQTYQDRGDIWGEALEKYLITVENLKWLS